MLDLSSLPYPSKFCKKECLERKSMTKGPALLKLPFLSEHQYPPDNIWRRLSCSANCIAMSRLGARWFDKTEQKRNTALKASYVSVATPNRGPKRIISSCRWVRRWYLIFCTTLLGSISAAISRTLAAAMLMSAYWEPYEHQQTIVNLCDLPDIHPSPRSQASTEVPKAQRLPS